MIRIGASNSEEGVDGEAGGEVPLLAVLAVVQDKLPSLEEGTAIVQALIGKLSIKKMASWSVKDQCFTRVKRLCDKSS